MTKQIELVVLLTKVAEEADRACLKKNGLTRLRDTLRLLHAYERRVGMRPDALRDVRAAPAEPIEELWLEFLSKDTLCGLCGNHGIIDTRGKVKSPAGVECGVQAFCICPNGRVLKTHSHLGYGYWCRACLSMPGRTDPSRVSSPAVVCDRRHSNSAECTCTPGRRLALGSPLVDHAPGCPAGSKDPQ